MGYAESRMSSKFLNRNSQSYGRSGRMSPPIDMRESGAMNIRIDSIPEFSYLPTQSSNNVRPQNNLGQTTNSRSMPTNSVPPQSGYAPLGTYGDQSYLSGNVSQGLNNQPYGPQGLGQTVPQGYSGNLGYQGTGNVSNLPANPGYVPPGYVPPGYNQPGFNQPGFNQPGFNQPGYNQPGYNQPGYVPPGYNPQGFNQPGYIPPNYNQPGYNPQNYNQPRFK